ncbi:hypothetical protein [Micromonospora andamanensis]
MPLRDENPDEHNWQREVDRTILRGLDAGIRDDATPPALAWETIEQQLWKNPFRCANVECCEALGRDHVTLITTAHMRRFCSVECIAAGQRAHDLAVGQHARLRSKLMLEAMERGDDPTEEHFRVLDEQATQWQRALSLHRHRCDPEPVPTEAHPLRDEDGLIDAARRCDLCMVDARQGLGFSVA